MVVVDVVVGGCVPVVVVDVVVGGCVPVVDAVDCDALVDVIGWGAGCVAIVVSGLVVVVGGSAAAATRVGVPFFQSSMLVDSVSTDITDSPDARAIIIAWLFG